jgi:hypothetical protein
VAHGDLFAATWSFTGVVNAVCNFSGFDEVVASALGDDCSAAVLTRVIDCTLPSEYLPTSRHQRHYVWRTFSSKPDTTRPPAQIRKAPFFVSYFSSLEHDLITTPHKCLFFFLCWWWALRLA